MEFASRTLRRTAPRNDTFEQKDGRTLHFRKATVPEEPLLKIYQILGLYTNPGGIKKMTL